MSNSQINTVSKSSAHTKWGDYMLLSKVKLSLTVVITSVLGFLIVSEGDTIGIVGLLWLFVGGFLVTAAANAVNQVLEKDYDSLMVRTADRPLAAGRMKVSEAVLFAGLACLIGVSILAMFNPVTALFGMVSFMLYSFIYTPLKRYSTLAVAVGAIPGALPVLIGCTAVEGRVSMLALILFCIQFLWQFPHFWSIGFLGFDDYQRAGFKLLPISTDQVNIDRKLGLSAVLYAALIIPLIIWLFTSGNVGVIGFSICLLTTIGYIYYSYQFHRDFDKPSAKALMFSSFFYMLIILITVLIS